MPAYFSHFKFHSLATEDFKDYLYEWFIEKHGAEMKQKLDSVDWDKWLYGRGMPPVTPKFDMTLATPAYNLADKWTKAAESNVNPEDLDVSKDDLKGWFAGQICVFLETLDNLSTPLSAKYISHMDSVYSFSTSKNAEIISRFYYIAMRGKWEKIYKEVANWLGTVGRMKFVRPGYRGLNEVDRELAVETFRKYEGFYHPICRALVKKDLKLD